MYIWTHFLGWSWTKAQWATLGNAASQVCPWTYFTSTTDDQHGSTVQGAQRLPPCHIQPQATWTHGYGLLWCHKCTRIAKQGIGGCRRSEEEEYTEYKITMVGCTKNKKGNEQKKMRPLPWGMMMTRDSLHTLGAGKPAGFVSRWNNGLLFHLFHQMISERYLQFFKVKLDILSCVMAVGSGLFPFTELQVQFQSALCLVLKCFPDHWVHARFHGSWKKTLFF